MKRFEDYSIKKVNKGQVILQAGKIPKSLFYLKKGFIKQYVDSNEGKELVLHIYEKGSLFPLTWGINNETPDFNLAAITNVEITLIPRTDFLMFIKENPDQLFELTKRLLYGISGLTKRIEIINFSNANSRVSQTLSYLQRHFGKQIHFTHEDLASLTGLTRERVSIEMKKLKDTKKVSYKKGKITFL